MKIAELEITPEWQNLALLAELPAEKLEIYNAGRSGAPQLFITEDDNEPTAKTLYKILDPQKGLTIVKGTQNIWVRSDYNKAKLMLSTILGE